MFLNVREMEQRKLRFDVSFPPGEIEFIEGKLWQATALHAVGSAELLPNTGGEIRLRGHLAVIMEAECDRCLDPARFPVDADFDLFYEPASASPRAEELAIDEAESELDFYEGDGLMLEDVLREQVLLALPMQRTCRDDCLGICPNCGQNRNKVACECRSRLTDDRWAALKNF